MKLWEIVVGLLFLYLGIGLAALPLNIRAVRQINRWDTVHPSTNITPAGAYMLMLAWPAPLFVVFLGTVMLGAGHVLAGGWKAGRMLGVGKIFTAPILIAKMSAPPDVTVGPSTHRNYDWD